MPVCVFTALSLPTMSSSCPEFAFVFERCPEVVSASACGPEFAFVLDRCPEVVSALSPDGIIHGGSCKHNAFASPSVVVTTRVRWSSGTATSIGEPGRDTPKFTAARKGARVFSWEMFGSFVPMSTKKTGKVIVPVLLSIGHLLRDGPWRSSIGVLRVLAT